MHSYGFRFQDSSPRLEAIRIHLYFPEPSWVYCQAEKWELLLRSDRQMAVKSSKRVQWDMWLGEKIRCISFIKLFLDIVEWRTAVWYLIQQAARDSYNTKWEWERVRVSRQEILLNTGLLTECKILMARLVMSLRLIDVQRRSSTFIQYNRHADVTHEMS